MLIFRVTALGGRRRKRALLLAIAIGAMAACSAARGTAGPTVAEPEFVLSASLIRVVDGDTIKVRIASGPITVRLHGIDTPERKQAFGSAATKALRTLLEGEPLEIEPIEQTDSYDRMVAKVYVRGADMNARLIESGYAWAYRLYLRREPADEHYCRLEEAARVAQRGVWVGDLESWEPPWTFRRRRPALPKASYASETAQTCIAAIGRRDPSTSTAPPPAVGVPPSADCHIKGNINSRRERIYHVSGSPAYATTRIDTNRGERWFCTEAEARAAGWRPPR